MRRMRRLGARLTFNNAEKSHCNSPNSALTLRSKHSVAEMRAGGWGPETSRFVIVSAQDQAGKIEGPAASGRSSAYDLGSARASALPMPPAAMMVSAIVAHHALIRAA
jgi:hypothetical protein